MIRKVKGSKIVYKRQEKIMEDTSRMIKKKSIKSYKNKGWTEGLSFPCFLG